MQCARRILLERVIDEVDVALHAFDTVERKLVRTKAVSHAREARVLGVALNVGRVLEMRIEVVCDELADLGSHATLGLENRHRYRELSEPLEERDIVAVDGAASRVDREAWEVRG
jgi:hypothetical protein